MAQNAWSLWVAWRLVRSRGRRWMTLTSWAAVAGVFLGVAALVIAMALMTGFQQDLKAKILGGIPHVTVRGLTPESLETVLTHLPTVTSMDAVKGAFPVVYGQALLVGPMGAQGVVVKGISPEVRQYIPILRRIVRGRWEALTSDEGIAIGMGLAQQIGVWSGERVRLIVPDVLVSPIGTLPRIRTLRVVAVFQSDMYEFDNMWAFIHLDLARRLFRPVGPASALEVMLKNVDEAPSIAQRLRQRFQRAGVLVDTWMEQNRALFAALQLEKWMLFVAITLIVVVASFNIITHLALLVHEKRGRVAMMMAMGADVQSILRVFLLQGLGLGVMGIGLGLIVGTTTSVVLDRYQLIRLPAEVYFIPYLPFRVQAIDALLIAIVALGIVLIATWLPVHQITRMRPADILRSPP